MSSGGKGISGLSAQERSNIVKLFLELNSELVVSHTNESLRSARETLIDAGLISRTDVSWWKLARIDIRALSDSELKNIGINLTRSSALNSAAESVGVKERQLYNAQQELARAKRYYDEIERSERHESRG